MQYGTTACGGNGDRAPLIQIRQHMLHVNGQFHLASAVIPGHSLMRHIQKRHSSARTEHVYCTLKMEVVGYYETFILNYQTTPLYHSGEDSFLWKVGSSLPSYTASLSPCRMQQAPRERRQLYQRTRRRIPQHFNLQYCCETLWSPTQKQKRNDGYCWSNL